GVRGLVEVVVGDSGGVAATGVVDDVLDHGQLGRRDVVIGEGAGLDVPGLDRAAAVGREGQRVGGSGVGDLDDPIGGAAHELTERAGLAAVDEAGDPPAGCGVLDLVEEVVGDPGGVAATGVVELVLFPTRRSSDLVVIGEGAGLDVPGLDRAAAVGREGQRVGGSGVGDLDDP